MVFAILIGLTLIACIGVTPAESDKEKEEVRRAYSRQFEGTNSNTNTILKIITLGVIK